MAGLATHPGGIHPTALPHRPPHHPYSVLLKTRPCRLPPLPCPVRPPYATAGMLNRVPFLNGRRVRDLPEARRKKFLTQVALKLQPKAFTQSEEVISRGEPGLEMFVVTSGVLVTNGRVVGKGQHIGDDFICQ